MRFFFILCVDKKMISLLIYFMSSQRVFVFVGVYDVYLNYKSNLIRLALLLGEGLKLSI